MNDYVLWQLVMFLFSRNAWERVVRRLWYSKRKLGTWDLVNDSEWKNCQDNQECFSSILIQGDANAPSTYYCLERIFSHCVWTKISILQFEDARMMVALFYDDGQVRWRYVYPDKKGRIALLSQCEDRVLYFTTPRYTRQKVTKIVVGDISLLSLSEYREVPLY